jgi:hypothetical protein
MKRDAEMKDGAGWGGVAWRAGNLQSSSVSDDSGDGRASNPCVFGMDADSCILLIQPFCLRFETRTFP